MKNFILFFSAFLFVFLSSGAFTQTDQFIRQSVIPVPVLEPGGIGNLVSGVDFDGDGKTEIYAVNDDWNDTPNELIPRIYKFEKNGNQWDSVWSATLDIPLQNTWPALTSGDLDKDGKMEIIWGPVNNLDASANPNPARIIVFESKGDGSDVMGVDLGNGNYAPNAKWNFNLTDNVNMRPFRWVVNDIDKDGVDEVIFADRAGSSSPFKFGVISVNNIPDNGDGSETWTIEYSGSNSPAQFVRSAVINADPVEPGGFGNIIAGVDFDADGKREIYAVNDDWNDTPNELIPRLYKFEMNGAYWEQVFVTAIPGIPAQNTWPALTYGDSDGDGKMEIFWGPVNNLTAESQNPPRIVVYETKGDGSDILGVDNGDGSYKPNAAYSILTADGGNERPFKWVLSDIDGDGKTELIYGARAGDMRFGIISVSNIPDNADGSETWTIEASALTAGMTVDGGTIYDLAVINNFAYLIHSSGNITPIAYENGGYVSKPVLSGLVPGGSWNNASVVDLDKNGQKEIVVGQWVGGSQVFLLKPNGDGLDAATIGDFAGLGSTRLNGGASGDIDGDGNLDFVFGSRTTYSTDEATFYRLKYKGGDILDVNNYETSIIDHGLMAGGQWDVASVGDVDGDGIDEAVFSGVPRTATEGLPLVVIDYSTGVIPGGTKYDVAVVNSNAYTIDNNGSINKFQYINGTWQLANTLTNVAGGYSSFKGSTVTDINNDGIQELVVGAWASAGAGKVYLLEEVNGGLKSTVIADLSTVGAVRLNGAASGDIDGDGNIDLVFGSRDSQGGIFLVKYKGGDIRDAANYSSAKIDEGIVTGANEIDIVTLANVDDDSDLEIVYSGIPRDSDPIPIVILDLLKVVTTPIADVKVDANGDFIPDNIGIEYTIMGVVTSINIQKNSADLGFYMQDETGGILIFANNDDSTDLPIGSKIRITGKVAHYNGVTELEVSDTPVNLVLLGVATLPEPIVVTVDDFLTNGEIYEATRIKFNGIAKTATSNAWPDASSTSSGVSMTFWDGYKTFTFRIDNDTDLKLNPEPTYPINAIGIASQFDSSVPQNSGYQLIPTLYSDITQGVAAPPSPYFFPVSPADGAVVVLTDSSQQFTATWTKSVDLNGDALIYQFSLLKTPAFNSPALNDSIYTFDGKKVLGWMAGKDTLVTRWTVKTKGSESAIVTSVDTFDITFVNDIATGVEKYIPKEFFVNQNYPNPFNPTTTIKFGIPQDAVVDLRIYNILGEETAVIFSNEYMKAGVYQAPFNASDLASGTYIYRLTTGNKIISKKMLFLK
ncbi:MAG: T9SS C-terminal target domain-containing protein [Ignavibacteriales bacterium]|nr:MAG: T9SS C-terminal target domain-containing protein [Ignavibacteriales bacterium]